MLQYGGMSLTKTNGFLWDKIAIEIIRMLLYVLTESMKCHIAIHLTKIM